MGWWIRTKEAYASCKRMMRGKGKVSRIVLRLFITLVALNSEASIDAVISRVGGSNGESGVEWCREGG